MQSHSIVIVGGGFAGTALAQALDGRLPAGFDLVLVSEESYTTFHPMLPEALGGSVFPEQVVAPIRAMLVRARFVMGRVTAIDPLRRTLACATLAGDIMLPYAQLVLAFGSRARLDLLPGLAEHALPLKTVGDAMHIRNVVLRRLARIELEQDAGVRGRLGRFIVLGGGFSGVECAGELADCLRGIRRYYPRVRDGELSITLLHDLPQLLPELPERLGAAAQRSLTDRGVDVRTGVRAARVCDAGVWLADGGFVEGATVVCTVGTQPNALAARASLPLERGRIVVDADLAVHGTPGVWAIGDCAHAQRARCVDRAANGAIRRGAGAHAGAQPAGDACWPTDAWLRASLAWRDGGTRAPSRRGQCAGDPVDRIRCVARLARLLPVADADARTQGAHPRRVDVGHVLSERHHPPAVYAQHRP